jgi:hypothetical protein
MSSSTEPKPVVNEEDEIRTEYSVEEDEADASDTDQFSHVKPNLLKTPSILNAIVDQIHPDIIAKFVVAVFR